MKEKKKGYLCNGDFRNHCICNPVPFGKVN